MHYVLAGFLPTVSNFSRLFLVTLAVCVLGACGGGSGGSKTEDKKDPANGSSSSASINSFAFTLDKQEASIANNATFMLPVINANSFKVNGGFASAKQFSATTFSLSGDNAGLFSIVKTAQSLNVVFNDSRRYLAKNTCQKQICQAVLQASLEGKTATLPVQVTLEYIPVKTISIAISEIKTAVVNNAAIKLARLGIQDMKVNSKAASNYQFGDTIFRMTGKNADLFSLIKSDTTLTLNFNADKQNITSTRCFNDLCEAILKATLEGKTTQLAISVQLRNDFGYLEIDANTRQYVNLDNAQVQSSEFPNWDLYIEREAIVLNEGTQSAYLKTTDFVNANPSSASLVSTQSYDHGKPSWNTREYKPSLLEWNRNWFGKSVFNAGLDGERMNWQTKPFGGLYTPNLAVSDVNGKDATYNQHGKLSRGLFYPRREDVNGSYSASNDKKDFVAIPQNQLVVRTSKGTKFIRLRAVQTFDYVDPNGEKIANTYSNNLYFKYAVQDLAVGDTSFGAERDMCISFTTGAKQPKYKQYQTIAKDSQYSNGIGRFKYGFMHSDGYYKQSFIDFDTIIQGPGSSVIDFDSNKKAKVTGKVYTVKGKDGSTNTYPEITNYNDTAATRMYSEGCMPAFWNDRQAGRYPEEYINGFRTKGADTPLHNRRADWLIDNPDATQTSYNGQDEWDVAFSLLVRPKNSLDFGRLTGISYAPAIVNSGRTGDNKSRELRKKGGLAAVVMVTGEGLDNYKPTDSLIAHTNASEAGNYTPVTSIDDPRVAGKWQATGRSMVERYNHIKIDNTSGTPIVTTNKRVYAIKTKNGKVRKFQVSDLTFDDNTATYKLTYK